MALPNTEAVRHALAAERTRRGLTLDELSGLAGISRASLTNLESGRSLGTVRTWFALAVALDVNVGLFLDHLHDLGAGSPGSADS